RLRERGGETLALVDRAKRVDDDARAVLGEPLGAGAADARRRAGYENDGSRAAHGCASSICAASLKSTASPAGRPISWTPTGSPSTTPNGTIAAGCPV